MKRIVLFLYTVVISTVLMAQISENDFKNPPMQARPNTYWMWMNGNITKEGLTKDLEYMKRTSYGAAMMFNVAVGIPQGPVKYGSTEWDDLTLHACKEAKRLGLELYLQNSPGYSGTGGPWITPEYSMKQLGWSEKIATTDKNGHINLNIPQPMTKLGYYKDIQVLAYPSLNCEQKLFKDLVDKVIVNGKEIDKSIVLDEKLETKIRMDEKQNEIEFQLSEPFEARAISVMRDREKPLDPQDGPRDYPSTFTIQVSSDGVHFTDVNTFSCPALRAMDVPGIASFKAVKGTYYRLITKNPTWICDVNFYSSPRLKDWTAKADFINQKVDLTENDQLIDKTLLIKPTDIVDISSKMDSLGNINWKAPKGRWTIVRIGQTTTGEVVAAAPTSGIGLDCDKFDKKALDKHFDLFLDPLLTKLKPYCGTTLIALMMDSWEAGKQNWTKNLPQYFKSKRGYDLTPYLLAMTGRIIGSVKETEHFLWDMRRTHTEMFNENFLDHFKKRAAHFNLKFAAEPYGDGNFESIEYAERLDYPMSEFWVHYIYGSVMTTKLVASTAHSFGKKIVGAECFTGAPFNSKFTEHPYALKAEGDWMMTLGINRFVYHTFAHQPYVGESGNLMTMGPFGTHLDRNSTWAEQAVGWNTYNSRCAAMLQQGLFVADVCILKNEAISVGIPDYDVEEPIVPLGYRWDVIGRTALLDRLSVSDENIVLPDGMSYRLLVIPEMKKVSPEVLLKIKQLISNGMNILLIGNKPLSYLGINSQKDAEVQRLATEIWNSTQIGKGKIFKGITIQQALDLLKISPDFQFSSENADAQIHWIHRSVNGEEMYFLSNHRRRPENIVATFRVHGLQPELWNAETTQTDIKLPYQTIGNNTKVKIHLDESGSAFIVFRKKGVGNVMVNDFPLPDIHKYANVKNSFSISFWAKPETFAYSGRGFIIYPMEGKKVFGAGHALVGISMGQNSVKIFERESKSKMVLESTKPVEGWTYVNLIYQAGVPTLFLNGEKIVTGKASGLIVHPGLGQPAAEEQYIGSFEGDLTDFQLLPDVLSETQIKLLFGNGLPFPIFPKGSTIISTLDSDWKVQFPTSTKAPAEITLPELISFRKLNNFNVKHFSGTATYLKEFILTRNNVHSNKHIYLDLGRVENIAEVTVNNQKVGLIWKAPYRIDITSFIKEGLNNLKVEVTNTLVNRLIGDEFYPQENIYDKYGRIVKIPDWYTKQEPRPQGERVIYSPWKFYSKTDPLLESGLLGPVRIITF
ncbi:MAG: glycosyl hydrolase [Paludibacter sp.]|nr:glycosyl hydrolase [Paludibacter sp.]